MNLEIELKLTMNKQLNSHLWTTAIWNENDIYLDKTTSGCIKNYESFGCESIEMDKSQVSS